MGQTSRLNWPNYLWPAAIILLLLYLLMGQLTAAWPFTIDDTFITLRYAKHLSHGQGLVWNIGEGPVEGFSSYSYLWFASVAYLLHLNPLVTLKCISVGGLFIGCYGLYRLSLFRVPQRLAVLAPLLLLLYPGEILWAVSGLETAFFQALIIWAVVLLQYPLNNAKTRQAAVLMAVASMTRPEAPILAMAWVMIQAYQQYQYLEDYRYRDQAKTFAMVFLALYLPFFLARWYYFGRLLPNPVYCKWGNAPAKPWTLDLSYAVLITPLALLALPYLRKRYKQARHAYLWLPSLIYIILLYAADWVVGFYNRHFLAAFALFLPLSVAGLHQWLQQAQGSDHNDKYYHYYALTACLVFGLLIVNHGYGLKSYRVAAATTWHAEQMRREFVDYLNTLPPQPTVLGDCGLIPFLYDHTIIDSYCINNRQFTEKPIRLDYRRFITQLMNEHKPSRIILLGLIDKGKITPSPADKGLMFDVRFRRDYRLSHESYVILPLAQPTIYGYRYQLYERRHA